MDEGTKETAKHISVPFETFPLAHYTINGVPQGPLCPLGCNICDELRKEQDEKKSSCA